MRGKKAESFAVLSLRILALSFAVVGILFIAVPNGVLDTVSDLGDQIGGFTRAPHGTEQLWLALAFSYMVVIAGICLIAQADVVRYRSLVLLLAVGKTASSLASLGFSYMVVIAGICLLAQADVVRYRSLLLVLALGKAASSLSSLAFYLFDEDVFAYLLNFLLDGSLVLVALWLWTLIGRIDRRPGAG